MYPLSQLQLPTRAATVCNWISRGQPIVIRCAVIYIPINEMDAPISVSLRFSDIVFRRRQCVLEMRATTIVLFELTNLWDRLDDGSKPTNVLHPCELHPVESTQFENDRWRTLQPCRPATIRPDQCRTVSIVALLEMC